MRVVEDSIACALTTPPVLEDYPSPLLKSIAIDGITAIDEVQKSICKECLKGRDIGSLLYKQRSECVCCCNAQCQNLPRESLSISTVSTYMMTIYPSAKAIQNSLVLIYSNHVRLLPAPPSVWN